MPANQFPDTPEKREIRRRNFRRLKKFCETSGLSKGAKYCGMPSVEFLDVVAWAESLCEAWPIERDPEILDDMRTQWDVIGLPLRVRWSPSQDILDFLENTNEVFDIYNLDFYGGFLNVKKDAGSRISEALRTVMDRQRKQKRSFCLAATFSLRENAGKEYSEFFDQIPETLSGFKNVDKNCKAHAQKRQREMKLCFPYFCCVVGAADSFEVSVHDIFYYMSSVPMIHFYLEFTHRPKTFVGLNLPNELVRIANRPLKQLKGLVPKTIFEPPKITR